MAITDHFEAIEEPGFRRSIDPEAARLQFNMSLGLVVILGIVSVGLALSLGFKPQTLEAQARAPIKLVVQLPQRAQVQQAVVSTKLLPGG